jgi:hypothetical protein
MKTFASMLQGIGLACTVGAISWYSPVAGVLTLGVELVVIGLALENR